MGGSTPTRTRILCATTTVVFAGLVAGCAAGPPAVSDSAPPDSATPNNPVAPQPVASQQGPQHIVVRAGQSLSRIAFEYRVPRREVIAANHLTPPYKIKIGQQLVIPSRDGPLMAPNAAESQTSKNSDDAPGVSLSAKALSQVDASTTPAGSIAAAAPPQPQEPRAAEQPSAASAFDPMKGTATVASNNPPIIDKRLDAPVVPAPTAAGGSPAPSDPVTPSAPATNAVPPAPLATAEAAPPGVTCPTGTTGMWSVDVIQIPMYVCR